MTLRATAAILALVVVFGAIGSVQAATVGESLIARSDSLKALGEAAKNAGGVDSSRGGVAVRYDSSEAGSSSLAVDSIKPRPDSLSSGSPRAPGDSASHKRSLPPRTLTLREQVMFAGGFMAFIALMMASMQNFNP